MSKQRQIVITVLKYVCTSCALVNNKGWHCLQSLQSKRERKATASPDYTSRWISLTHGA